MASIWIPCPKISWVAPVGSTGGQQPQQQKQMLSFQNSSNPNPSLSFASSAPFSGFQVMSSRGLFSLLFFRQFSLSNFSFSLIWPFGYVLRGLFDIKLWFFLTTSKLIKLTCQKKMVYSFFKCSAYKVCCIMNSFQFGYGDWHLLSSW